MKQDPTSGRLAASVVLALLLGCADDSASSAGDGTGAGSDAVTACKDLCQAQASGEDCSGEPSQDCLGICELFAEREGECADRTRRSFECKQGMSWRCSSGSDQAFSTDDLCGAEQDAVFAACDD